MQLLARGSKCGEDAGRRKTLKGSYVRIGIRMKLGMVVFCVIALTLLASGIWDVLWVRDRGVSQLRHTAEMASGRLSGALALPLWEMEKQKVEEIVNSEMGDDGLYAVVIRSPDGKNAILSKRRDKDWKIVDGEPESGEGLISGKNDVLRSKGANQPGETIGKLEVYYTDRFLAEELRGRAVSIALKGGAALLVIVGALYLSLNRLILNPLLNITSSLKENSGDLTHRIEIHTNDEIAELAEAFNGMTSRLASTLSRAASISGALSSGASEQAEALREAAASLDRMASATKRNAEASVHATGLTDQAKEVVRTANDSMDLLTVSMKEISVASEETQKIVKTIDEIAFQTNLLALNAAVEAARAGEAGAGFAVVADEVRNLAMRAAEAARNTAALIEETVKKIGNGARIVLKTNEEFDRVGAITLEVGKCMGEVAAASDETASGVNRVAGIIDSMRAITNQNAGEAEELASMVGEFHNGGRDARAHTDMDADAAGGFRREIASANGKNLLGAIDRGAGKGVSSGARLAFRSNGRG